MSINGIIHNSLIIDELKKIFTTTTPNKDKVSGSLVLYNDDNSALIKPSKIVENNTTLNLNSLNLDLNNNGKILNSVDIININNRLDKIENYLNILSSTYLIKDTDGNKIIF
jgi:hypothetical protein